MSCLRPLLYSLILSHGSLVVAENLPTSSEQQSQRLEMQRQRLLAEKQVRIQAVADQEREIDLLIQQMDAIPKQDQLNQLLKSMQTELATMVANDPPFHQAERQAEMAELARLVAQPEVQAAEKLRSLLAAYEKAMKLGRELETYEAELDQNSDRRFVQFLRYGRLGLAYVTLDGRQGGVWDRQHQSWRPLPASLIAELERGMHQVRRERPPDLVVMPIAQKVVP